MGSLLRLCDKLLKTSDYTSESIISRLTAFDVVSFDIYDTAIRRNTLSVSDVFVRVAEIYNKKKGEVVETQYFCNARFQAMSIAQNKCKLENMNEITLDEIYDNIILPESCSAEELKKIEESVEIEISRRNETIYRVYEWCIKQGKKVIFTSDMYLGKDVLEKCLKHCGYRNYDDIFVSSQYREKKETGELFKRIIAEKYSSKSMIHIGDSLSSDYFGAYKGGVRAIHVGKFPNKCRYTKLRWKKKATKKDWKNLKKVMSTRIDESMSNAFLYGYEIFGVLLYGFCKWLHENAMKDGIDHIFFLSRDGMIIKRAYDILYLENQINNSYLYVSRRALHTPLVWHLEDISEFFDLFKRNFEWNCEKLCDWLGLQYQETIYKWVDAGIGKEEIIGNSELLKDARFKLFYENVKSDVVANSLSEYTAITKYLQKEGFKGKVGIVDIGWRGRMQRSLSQLCELQKSDTEIIGYYVGLYDSVEAGNNMKAYMPSSTEVLNSTGEIFEYMFSNPFEGSTRRALFSDNGNITISLFDCEYEEGSLEKNVLSEIQAGAVTFIKDINDIYPTLNISRESAVENIISNGRHPSKDLLDLFNDVRFGDDGYKMIEYKNLKSYIRSPKDLARDWHHSGWHIGFAKSLLKIPFPYYQICVMLRR